MTVTYISTEDAVASDDLCMTVVSSVPSPWGEAAKGILHVKGLSWNAVRYNPMDKAQSDWAGGYANAPTLVPAGEPPINGWREILSFAETVQPDPVLIPKDQSELCISLSEKFCGSDGLGWHRRLLGIHAGLTGQGGFSLPIAQYLGMKYGYSADRMEETETRIVALIAEFSARLQSQKAAGSLYFIGNALSCVDIYSACFMAMYDPLPEDQCAMHPKSRAVFTQRYPNVDSDFDPISLAHRDYIYEQYLNLPLSL